MKKKKEEESNIEPEEREGVFRGAQRPSRMRRDANIFFPPSKAISTFQRWRWWVLIPPSISLPTTFFIFN